jgi:hypothetical protein
MRRRSVTEPNMRRTADLLTRRIAELDDVSYRGGRMAVDGDARSLLAHFIWVIERVTEPFMRFEAGKDALIDPAIADQMVKASRLLDAIADYTPSLTRGALQIDRQHWTVTSPSDELDAISTEPRIDDFVAPWVKDPELAVKPSNFGLYTSTATYTGWSMWREYLQPFRGSSLYPLPWRTWALHLRDSDIRVAEIVTAMDWVHLVDAHAIVCGDHIYPDWANIACEFDAVHIMLPAIAAAQGFYLPASEGTIPPAFWDVETTFWLRWNFSGARLIETST